MTMHDGKDRMDPVFARIEALTPAYEILWERICSFETPSDNKEALDEQSRYLAAYAKANGFHVTEYPFPRAGNCLTAETRPGQAPRIALLAHLDTVHPVGSFGETPVRRDGDTLYGPGVIDCKGGACVALMAAQALMETEEAAPPIRIILTTDEEVSARYSGPEGVAFIQDQARGVDAAFNCETGLAGYLTVGRKGIIRLQIDVRGKAGHAGNDYFLGVSAIKEAAHKILAIEALSSPDGATFNCGVIAGGTKANVIPGQCRFEVDIRGKTLAVLEQALEQVKAIAEKSFLPGTTATVKILSRRPPMEHTPETDRLFEKVCAVSRRYGLEEVKPKEKGGGSDSAYLVPLGIPTLCSFGPTGTGEHTSAEQGYIPSLQGRAKLLAGSIMEVAAGE